MSARVSVSILTKNEEQSLPHCLAALAAFEDIVVVDSESVDNTVRIAEAAGARVVPFRWNGAYPKKKQWTLDNVDFQNDWVLMLDADEVVSPALAAEIASLPLGSTGPRAYDAPLEYVFLGTTLRHGHQVRKRILVDRGAAYFPVIDDLAVSRMWEVEGHYQPIVEGVVGTLASPLRHDDKDPLFDYFARHNRYSEWEAYLRAHPSVGRQVARARTSGGRLFQRVPFKPLVFFLYSYVAKAGWRDGRAGFHYAVAHAFYFWQIVVKTAETET